MYSTDLEKWQKMVGFYSHQFRLLEKLNICGRSSAVLKKLTL